MADDREQRGFEVVKLRIAYLQHITTLSGAAILIILALIQRAPTADIAVKLAVDASTFVYAVLISVFSIGTLLGLDHLADVDHSQKSPGRRATFFASGAFGTGVAIALFTMAGLPLWTPLVIMVVLPVPFIVVFVAWSLLIGKLKRRDPDPDDGDE